MSIIKNSQIYFNRSHELVLSLIVWEKINNILSDLRIQFKKPDSFTMELGHRPLIYTHTSHTHIP